MVLWVGWNFLGMAGGWMGVELEWAFTEISFY